MNKLKEFFSVKRNVFITAACIVALAAVLCCLLVAGVFDGDYDYRSVGGGANSRAANTLVQSLREVESWTGQSISFEKIYTDGRKELININILSGDKYTYRMNHLSRIIRSDGETESSERTLYINETLYSGSNDSEWPYEQRNIINTGEFTDMVEFYVGDYAERLAVIGPDIIIRLYMRKSGQSMFYKAIFDASQAGEILDGATRLEIIVERTGNITKQVSLRYNLERSGAQDSRSSFVSIVFSHFDGEIQL